MYREEKIQESDKDSCLLISTENESHNKIYIGKLPKKIKVPINDQIDENRDQDKNSEAVSVSEINTAGIEKDSCLASTENETMNKPSNNSIISIEKSNKHKSGAVYLGKSIVQIYIWKRG